MYKQDKLASLTGFPTLNIYIQKTVYYLAAVSLLNLPSPLSEPVATSAL
jgi:hypothetical protein